MDKVLGSDTTLDLASIQNHTIIGLHDLWHQIRGSDGLPVAEELGKDRLGEAWNRIAVFRPANGSFVCEYFGLDIVKATGVDLTGILTRDAAGQSGICSETIYWDCMERRVPVYSRQANGSGASLQPWEYLVMPVAEAGARRFCYATSSRLT